MNVCMNVAFGRDIQHLQVCRTPMLYLNACHPQNHYISQYMQRHMYLHTHVTHMFDSFFFAWTCQERMEETSSKKGELLEQTQLKLKGERMVKMREHSRYVRKRTQI
jgi:hypothetical protein